MSKNIYNRVQITKNIAQRTGTAQAQVRHIIAELENQMIVLGSSRGRVQIKEFGIFRIYKRKSTTIKQIRTKKNRLVIPQKVIKFIATEKFKQKIKGGQDKVKFQTSQEPAGAGRIIEDGSAKINKGHRISLQPLTYFDRVSKERFKAILSQRLSNIKRQVNLPDKKYMDNLPEGRLILSILRTARLKNKNKIYFLLKDGVTEIFTTKPRELIGKLPNDLCKKFFIEYLDLEIFDIPQHRTKIVQYRSNNCGTILLDVDSLPVRDGISIGVNFRFKF